MDRYDIVGIVEKIYEYYEKNNHLDRVKICFHYISWHLDGWFDKETGFTKIFNLFSHMANDVNKRRHLYDKKELVFFDMVISSTTHTDFFLKYRTATKEMQKAVCAKLRRNIVEKQNYPIYEK